MAFKDRLKQARADAKLKQQDIADAFEELSPQAVSGWERGEAMPEPDKLPIIAKVVGRTVDWLLEKDDSAAANSPRILQAGGNPPPEFLGERDLKVYAATEGGQGVMVVSTDPIEWVPRPWYLKNVRDGYAVLVVGDSMEPAFEAGDMAVVNPRLAHARGKDVILVAGESAGEFTATIKRLLSWTEKEWRVRQFNPAKDFVLSRREWPKALRVVGKYYGG
jgi:phage repressor protein C with HTH and peptisase S24 domain